MGNSIALAQKYLPILDAKYKRESLTSRLDVANGNVQFIGGNTVKVFKTDMDGLGNYSRDNGFVKGGDDCRLRDVISTESRSFRSVHYSVILSFVCLS